MSVSSPTFDLYDSSPEISKVEIAADGEMLPTSFDRLIAEVQSEPLPGTSKNSSPQRNLPIEIPHVDLDPEAGVEIKPFKSSGLEAKKSIPKSVSFATDLEQAATASATTSGIGPTNVDGSPSSVRRVQQEKSTFLKGSKPKPLEVACRYASCGCQAKVPRGTVLEEDHYQNCQFRPIPCLLDDICQDVLPYHDFVLHMITHYVQPEYAMTLNTRMYLWGEDFQHDQKWIPKWLSAQGHHFFVMMQRKIPGIWVSWVWMLGTKEEAEAYKATIVYFKGLRSVGATFVVHSIREPQEQIEMSKSCLLLTDQAMISLSQIGESVVTDFSVSIQISMNDIDMHAESTAEAVVETRSVSSEEASTSSLAQPRTSIFEGWGWGLLSAGDSAPAAPEAPVHLPPITSSEFLPSNDSGFIKQENSTPQFTTLPALSPSEHRGFVQTRGQTISLSPLAPVLIEDGSVSGFGSESQIDANEGEDIGEDGLSFEEVLKIFASNRSLPAYDSSVSTAVSTTEGVTTERNGSVDLDKEFLYNIHNHDETID